jgi:hypothetical protein
MGLKYKVIKSERKELSKVTCDHCDKNIKLSKGRWNPMGKPHTMYHEPMAIEEDYFVLRSSWGYYSRKDYDVHEAVLCEACYDIVFKDVKILITNDMCGQPPRIKPKGK